MKKESFDPAVRRAVPDSVRKHPCERLQRRRRRGEGQPHLLHDAERLKGFGGYLLAIALNAGGALCCG